MKQRNLAALRSWAFLVGGLIMLLVCYFTIPLDTFGPERPVLSWLTFGTAITVLAGLLLRKMWQMLTQTGGRPGVGLVFLIELSMVVFSATYFVLAHEFTDLHTRLDALYFTVVTMATVGYGDITPSAQTARLLVTVQIFYNFVFLATAAGTVSTRVRSQVGSRLDSRRPTGDGSGTDGSAADG